MCIGSSKNKTAKHEHERNKNHTKIIPICSVKRSMEFKIKNNNKKEIASVLFRIVITIQFMLIIVPSSSTHIELNRARHINNCFIIIRFSFSFFSFFLFFYFSIIIIIIHILFILSSISFHHSALSFSFFNFFSSNKQ